MIISIIELKRTIKVFKHRLLCIFLREISMFSRKLPIDTEGVIEENS